ncbi:pentatricopeptide repeat-containing protein At4g20770 [Andrographis paniculata]|uniref:pentatricopeptide repeat-containing protein At4g20770 n=1 Tax=Andrographis paniculata TaxID=175694 RepID=UPI0021E96DC2|nr:pentatricopeptide repeat-containing protein At4g20770 [Andrographis paniculata]
MQIKTSTSLADALQFCIDRKAHRTGKIIQARIFRTNQLSDTFLVNRLIELYSKCGNVSAARDLFDLIPLKNIFSYHAVLGSYCKMNDLHNAHQVFDQMPERNEVSWNMMISMLSRTGPKEAALEGYYSMRQSGFLPTRFTLASVLSACGGLSRVVCGRECHGVAIKLGLEDNMYVGNALLGMYMKCKCITDAVDVFKGLPEHNEVSFTSMMEGLVESGCVNEALDMFRLMHRAGIVDCVSLSTVLGVCSKSVVEEFLVNNGHGEQRDNIHGKQIHGLLAKLGFEKDQHVNNSLLDMYAKHGCMECAEMLFNSMLQNGLVSSISWNVMIAGYGKQHSKDRALECMERMQSGGYEPDEFTYVNLLSACLKSGDVAAGLKIFNGMSLPSLASWNAMLSGYFQNEFHSEAVMLFREMQLRNVRPDRTTFAIVLSACASIGLLDSGKQIHGVMLKEKLCDDLYVASGLIGLYSKCGKIDAAKQIFDMVPQHDTVCWNSMLAGLSVNLLDAEAFALFKRMLLEGVVPSEFSYTTILNCCSSSTSLSFGEQVNGLVVKSGHANDVYVGTALVDVYCKCGDVNGARTIFDTMPCKNSITWNEMIHGYAQHGCGEDAVGLFHDMIRSNFKPDCITFVAVLTACSHSGMADAGLEIFNAMQQEHGMEPVTDHYTCVIDSLGRAGRFNEIEEIIDKMPCRDDPIVWEVLLSSCRVHSNVNLARRAADELFRLDPHNSAPYSLLANMYSSLDRWDDVKNVRDIMKEHQISKERGYSWTY